ncbi:MAG: DHA2 family efflux MFS transporter permease subunit [Acidobacteria bacterium]|nr:DHA2 family efflux MFS transporter permease subunit [Acidobacteriota bacterium]
MSNTATFDDSSAIPATKETPAAPPQAWTPSFNPWLIAASVMSATFMEVLDTSVANVALPHIAGNLSASTDEATWVLTSYLIANAIILPATGWLTTVFGRKKFLITCIIIFTAASALCGAATNINLLIIARILQGAGGGALQPIAQSVLLESFPPEKRGSAMALYGLGVVVAPIIGPTLGGWITDNYSWRWIFYINLPIGILASFMAGRYVEDPPYLRNQKPGRIDYIGFGLMALGLAALELTLDLGQQRDWFSSPTIVFTTAVAVAALVTFVVWELYTPEPIVNLRVFMNRNFAVGTVMIASVGVVLYGSTALLPLFLQTLLGYPAVQSGLAVSPRGLGSMVSMLVVGRLIGRIDGRYLIAFGFLVLAFSTDYFTGITLDIAQTNIIYPMIISGFAMGFVFVPLTTMTMGTLSNEQIGNASGIYNLMRNTGGSIGIAAMTTFLARGAQTHQAALAPNLTPYNPAFQEMVARVQQSLGGASVEQAYGVVYNMLVRQAAILSYIDNFRLLVILCLLCVPAAFLFKKVTSAKPPPGAH